MDPVEQAFKRTPRAKFLPPDMAGLARFDNALPIGFGQTISQPTTVQLMLEWLEVEPGNKILDVGSGSGWTTALLSHLTGVGGHVYAVEIIPELVEFGRTNCARLGIKNVKVYQAGKDCGLPRFGPYERILVSAAAEEVPNELLDQLKVGGKMVIPVRHEILEIEKLGPDKYETTNHPGFVFVPLVKG